MTKPHLEADGFDVSGLVGQMIAPLCETSALTVDPVDGLDESAAWKLKDKKAVWTLKLACRGPYCVLFIQAEGEEALSSSFYARSRKATQNSLVHLLRQSTSLHL